MNAEESESEGFEIQLKYLPPLIDGLRLTAAYGYNDSNYVKFVGPCAGGQLPSQGCNIPDGGLVSQNLNGSKRALAPENRANFGLNYNNTLSNGLEFGLNANMKYSSRYKINDVKVDSSIRKLSNKQLSSLLEIESGDWYNTDKIDKTIKTFKLDNKKQEHNLIDALKIACRRFTKEKTGKRPFTNINLVRI
mgnify:CR=1 FL=1